MNKQKTKTGRGVEWTDFSWNVVAGCFHNCRWSMPDGTIAVCYAETVAGRVAQQHYPEGFAHHYWHPDRLPEPLRVKTPARIFVGSMADLFGHWVPAEHIEQVLEVCRQADWHTFQLLTKNPVRAKDFDIPANCWLGASVPPDFMFDKPLKLHQQDAMLNRTLTSLAAVDVSVRWLSIEPLSRDYSAILAAHPGVLQWAVIGAASAGPRHFAPSEGDFRNTLSVLDADNVAVFFKGNLASLDRAKNAWREDYPAMPPTSASPDNFDFSPPGETPVKIAPVEIVTGTAAPLLMLPAPTGRHLLVDYCYLPPKQLRLNRILCADTRHYSRTLPDKSIDCVVTSPPYFNQRDYGITGQIGLEKSIEEYVNEMVLLFREIRRALKDDGTLWLNLGDSFAASGRGGGGKNKSHQNAVGRKISRDNQRRKPVKGFKQKDLLGIPWRVALALQADGWFLRCDNIWHKTSSLPESVRDRPSRIHEYMFLFSKSRNYWYDAKAVRLPAAESTVKRGKRGVNDGHKYVNGTALHGSQSLFSLRHNDDTRPVSETRNLPSVWSIPPAQYKGKHTATMPPAMVEICLKAGCRKGGIVYDPFTGAGTTALVALRLDRNFVGCELNPETVEEARQRLAEDSPMQPKTIRAKRGGEQAVQFSLFAGL